MVAVRFISPLLANSIFPPAYLYFVGSVTYRMGENILNETGNAPRNNVFIFL